MKKFLMESGRVVGIMAIVVTLFGLFIGALTSTMEQERQESFARAVGKCKLEAVDLNVRFENLPERFNLCLNAKGYDNAEIPKRLKQLPL